MKDEGKEEEEEKHEEERGIRPASDTLSLRSPKKNARAMHPESKQNKEGGGTVEEDEAIDGSDPSSWSLERRTMSTEEKAGENKGKREGSGWMTVEQLGEGEERRGSRKKVVVFTI